MRETNVGESEGSHNEALEAAKARYQEELKQMTDWAKAQAKIVLDSTARRSTNRRPAIKLTVPNTTTCVITIHGAGLGFESIEDVHAFHVAVIETLTHRFTRVSVLG